jgi:hypothetical protein
VLEVEGSPAHTLARLARELQHVNERLRLEHAMTLDWKARSHACEKQRASLEKKRHTARRKPQTKSGQTRRRMPDPGDAILDWLQEQETDQWCIRESSPRMWTV